MPIIRLNTIDDPYPADELLKAYNSPSKFEYLAGNLVQFRETGEREMNHPHILVFAGDHGFIKEAMPDKYQTSTYQVVQDYIAGNAEILRYCQKNELKFLLCDVGIDGVFAENTPEFVKFKIRAGTRNMMHEPAMTTNECEAALDAGRTLVNGVQYRGCNTVAFGAIGFGGQLSATLLNNRLKKQEPTNLAAEISQQQDESVMPILQAIANRYAHLKEPMEWLTAMGGFEMAAIVGGILQAEENEMTVLIDGFIPSVALAMAKAVARS